MRKIFKSGLLIALGCLMCLSSCSDDSIKVVSTKISGPLGDYYEIVDKPYKFVEDYGSVDLSVEIKRIKDGGPEDSGTVATGPHFIIEFMDADGNVIESDNSYELEKVYPLKVGESASVTFSCFGLRSRDASKVRQIKVSSSAGDESSKDVKPVDPEEMVAGIKPESTKVSGPLKEMFEVVDKPLPDDIELFAPVQFKRLGGEFPLKPDEQLVSKLAKDMYGNVTEPGKFLFIGLKIEWLDENGTVIRAIDANESDVMKLAEFDEGDTGSVNFFLPDGITPAKFRITSTMEHKIGK